MNKPTKIIIFSLTGLLAFSGAYFAGLALYLRAETPQRFEQAVARVEHPVSHVDLSTWQLEALLAIQDPNFFTHSGTDFGSGVMTTITQGLAKSFYFDGYEPGPGAKYRQSLLARFALDPVVSKEDQLDLFLGSVYLGHVGGGQAVRGFHQAADIFFQKTLGELTKEEYLALLATLPAPNLMGPHANPEANARQAARIGRLADGECSRAGMWHGHQVSCPEDV